MHRAPIIENVAQVHTRFIPLFWIIWIPVKKIKKCYIRMYSQHKTEIVYFIFFPVCVSVMAVKERTMYILTLRNPPLVNDVIWSFRPEYIVKTGQWQVSLVMRSEFGMKYAIKFRPEQYAAGIQLKNLKHRHPEMYCGMFFFFKSGSGCNFYFDRNPDVQICTELLKLRRDVKIKKIKLKNICHNRIHLTKRLLLNIWKVKFTHVHVQWSI